MLGGAGLDERLFRKEGVVVCKADSEREVGVRVIETGRAEVDGVGEAFGGAMFAGDSCCSWTGKCELLCFWLVYFMGMTYRPIKLIRKSTMSSIFSMAGAINISRQSFASGHLDMM